jgi:hypothetical protein
MRGAAVAAVLVLLAAGAGAHAGETRSVDATLAVVGRSLVTLSDVTMARALGVFGLEPSNAPVTSAELERYLDGQLAAREAVQLALDVPAADVEAAWQRAGGAALGARLHALGIDPAWARRLLEADLQARRFLDLRVRAFVFVTESDVDDALGGGPSDDATRARTRAHLEAEAVARALDEWREDARARTRIRRIPAGDGPWPPPFRATWPRAAPRRPARPSSSAPPPRSPGRSRRRCP